MVKVIKSPQSEIWILNTAMTFLKKIPRSYTAAMANNFARTRRGLLPSHIHLQSFYHYDGGLTTLPCSEVVWWNLASTPLKISSVAQYQALTYLALNIYRSPDSCRLASVASPSGSTSRPVQRMNGRGLGKIRPV
jgi:hypothetical protein